LSGLAIVSDDFSEYASTASLLANINSNIGGTGSASSLYSDGHNPTLAEIDKTVLYNGHPTLKFNQPGGTANTPQLAVRFAATNHIWYRVKVRFSPGFTTKGTLTNSSNAYKLLSWGWDGTGFDGSGRIEITNTTQYELYETVLARSNGATVGGGNILNGGNISTEWSDGGWYDYIVEVDHSTAAGMIRLWRGKSGSTPTYIGQAAEKTTTGAAMPALTGITVGLNFNQVRTASQTQALWWGEWEVVDGSKHSNPFGVPQ
jgi:hypothetical protein